MSGAENLSVEQAPVKPSFHKVARVIITASVGVVLYYRVGIVMIDPCYGDYLKYAIEKYAIER